MKKYEMVGFSLNPFVSAFAQVDLKNVTLTIQDGDSPENSIEIHIGEGNLTYSEKVERDYTLNRGLLDEVRNGDEQPMDVRFDFIWDYIQGTVGTGGVPSIEDALKKINAASAWVSTDADACRPFCVDLILSNVPTPDGCGDTETITLPDFRYESLDHDLRAGTVACAGRCNATQAIKVREA